MAEVVVYTTAECPYCLQAKRLLERKGVDYREVDVGADPARRREMMEASGRRSVPQILIGGESIGGFDDLRALEQSGELEAMLARPA